MFKLILPDYLAMDVHKGLKVLNLDPAIDIDGVMQVFQSLGNLTAYLAKVGADFLNPDYKLKAHPLFQ